MIRAKHLTILSGGGSPHTDEYGPVYGLIDEEAALRGWSTHLIDYVGVGHAPEFGMGLNLSGAVEKAWQDLQARPAPQGSTLLCRSFGCDVGAYLLANHGDEMSAFSRVVLWGPSAFHLIWTLAERDRGGIDKVNFMSLSKGVQWSPTYWKTTVPIEESVKQIKGIQVGIGYGTKDQYCDAPFANYLAGLIQKHTDCAVHVCPIKGAGHEIRPDPAPGGSAEEHERIKREYFALIFGHDPEPGSQIQQT